MAQNRRLKPGVLADIKRSAASLPAKEQAAYIARLTRSAMADPALTESK